MKNKAIRKTNICHISCLSLHLSLLYREMGGKTKTKLSTMHGGTRNCFAISPAL